MSTTDSRQPRHSASAAGPSLHQTITEKIVRAIEAGAGEWVMPWHRPGASFTMPLNALTGAHYQGCNVLSLWIDADEKKFDTAIWATFKQWQDLGAQVRKGEKGSLIVKYGRWTPKDARGNAAAQPRPETADKTGDEHTERMYARAAWVFNARQVDGFPVPGESPRSDLTQRLAHVDQFLTHTGISFREGGTRAFYRQPTPTGDGDYVQMPPRYLFTGTATSTPTEAYEATRLHEAAHATGAPHRLNRELGQRFGDERYAMEELVALSGQSGRVLSGQFRATRSEV